ncbi:MAG: RluA family pseudouridine synthase [Proteobacteria bacterium]|nr:RluA family pseudouridine synthase [Pseudomonadota bacterium]
MSEKMIQNRAKKVNSKQIVISNDAEGQRIDNFLIRYFGKIPKSRIYQMLRKGEVRINSGRVKQTYKLKNGDLLRVPPVYPDKRESSTPTRFLQLKIFDSVIFEDDGLIIINKPAGIVVHSGSGQAHGVIEAFRAIGGEYESLELVHRLDKDTSGCLILAKNSSALRQLHTAIKNEEITKSYCALLAGRLNKKKLTVNNPLRKNTVRSGERIVTVDKSGKSAVTIFSRERTFNSASLVNIELITGRTHQIRVHSASIGHSVIGDLKYGDRTINREFRKRGLKRMFLHAKSLKFKSPATRKITIVKAPLEQNLINLLDKLSP